MTKKLDQVAIRMVEAPPLFSEEAINSPEKAIKISAKELIGYDREVVCVVNLQSDLKPINFNIVSIGTLNSSLFSTRDIMKSVILSNAANIILLHLHPSGNLIPSHDDVKATDALVMACNIHGISMLDHIIISGKGEKNYYSFREKSILSMDKIRFQTEISELDFKAHESRKASEKETIYK